MATIYQNLLRSASSNLYQFQLSSTTGWIEGQADIEFKFLLFPELELLWCWLVPFCSHRLPMFPITIPTNLWIMYIVTEWSKPSDLDKMGVNCSRENPGLSKLNTSLRSGKILQISDAIFPIMQGSHGSKLASVTLALNIPHCFHHTYRKHVHIFLMTVTGMWFVHTFADFPVLN